MRIPTDVLRDEHAVILRGLDLLEAVVFPLAEAVLAEAVLDEPAIEWVAHEFSAVEAGQGRGASLHAAQAAVDAFGTALADPARS